MIGREQRTLCLLDIAMPRNVEPEVANVEGVRLIDIDGVGTIMGPVILTCNPAIRSVEAIVDAAVRDFDVWSRSRQVSPLLSAISQRADSIRESELQRLLGRCPELTQRERQLLIGMTMRVVSRLMHPAYSNVVKLLDDGNVAPEVIEALFDLEHASDAAAAAPLASDSNLERAL
jgi:glutamyl-tRNA reductase